MRTVLALLALVAITQAITLTDLNTEEWHTYKVSKGFVIISIIRKSVKLLLK